MIENRTYRNFNVNNISRIRPEELQKPKAEVDLSIKRELDGWNELTFDNSRVPKVIHTTSTAMINYSNNGDMISNQSTSSFSIKV